MAWYNTSSVSALWFFNPLEFEKDRALFASSSWSKVFLPLESVLSFGGPLASFLAEMDTRTERSYYWQRQLFWGEIKIPNALLMQLQSEQIATEQILGKIDHSIEKLNPIHLYRDFFATIKMDFLDELLAPSLTEILNRNIDFWSSTSDVMLLIRASKKLSALRMQEMLAYYEHFCVLYDPCNLTAFSRNLSAGEIRLNPTLQVLGDRLIFRNKRDELGFQHLDPTLFEILQMSQENLYLCKEILNSHFPNQEEKWQMLLRDHLLLEKDAWLAKA